MMASFACTCVHSAKGYLIHFLHASSIPVLFYYLCGLALTLAMIGTLYHTSGLGMLSYSFKYIFIMIFYYPVLIDCCRGCCDTCTNIYCWDCYCYQPYGYGWYGGGYGYGGGNGVVCCDCCNGAACDCNACCGQVILCMYI